MRVTSFMRGKGGTAYRKLMGNRWAVTDVAVSRRSRTNLGQEVMQKTKGLMHLSMNQALVKAVLNGTERGRFELPLPLRADRFSKPAHSTALPPLRVSGGS